MKKTKLLVAAVIGMLTLVSCGENKKEGEAIPMQNDKRMPTEGDEGRMGNQSGNLDDGQQTGNIEFEDKNIASVYEHYQDIKSALVNSNSEEAQNGAEKLVSTIENNDNGNEEVLNSARTIAESNDINQQRKAFLDLSSGVEGMISGALASGEIYKLHCPMAFDGKGGSWLSSSEEVRNPYYGEKMLKCGSVRETIQ